MSLFDEAKTAVNLGVIGASKFANAVWSILPKATLKRAIESAFRADRDANVTKTINMFADEARNQNPTILYILTGADKGDKSNRSLHSTSPEEVEEWLGDKGESVDYIKSYREAADKFEHGKTYTGMWVNGDDRLRPGWQKDKTGKLYYEPDPTKWVKPFDPNMYTNDLIDGIIYNKTVDRSIGRQLTAEEKANSPYKSANLYIITEPNDVPIYSQEDITPIVMNNGHKYSGAHGNFMTASGYPIDNAGTVNQYGIRNDSVFVRGLDNWGVNHDDSRSYAGKNQSAEESSASDELMDKVKGLVGSISIQTPWVYIGDADKYGIHQGSIEMVKQYGNSSSGKNYNRLLSWIKQSGSEISPILYNTRTKRSVPNEEHAELFRSTFPEVTDLQIDDYNKSYKRIVHKQGGTLNYFNYFK